VYREMQAINLLNSGTLEDLDTLVGNAPEDDITAHLVYFVKKDYIERELASTAKEFALNSTEDLAERLQGLLAEKNALKQNKPNGRLDNVYQEFLGLIDTEKPLLQTFDKLDNYLGGGLSGGQLVVIGARPAVGKTALGTSMAMEILQKNEGITIDFFTLEMTAWQLTARFVSRKAKINSILFRNPHNLSEKNKQITKQAFQEIMQHDLRVYGAEYEQLNDIKQVIYKRAKDKAGRYVAFIDYAGLVGVTDSRKTERQVMNEVTRTLKLLTNELDITIILFAQLNRGMEQRAEKKPTLADLKESGSLEQDANVVLLL
ncbi:DnaB-like helicase C-terminal domain-containing protein, partial [Enterococcus villorum]